MNETTVSPPIVAILEWVYTDQPTAATMCIPADTGAAPPIVVLAAAARQGLVARSATAPDTLVVTNAGQAALARFWGPDRNPPGVGGYYTCDHHGVYDSHPGDRKGCPDCRAD